MSANGLATARLGIPVILSLPIAMMLLAVGCGGGGISNPAPPVPPSPLVAASPAFWPVPGSYSQTQAGQSITLSDSTPGATIHYTTDGTTPTSSSTQYTGPITISSTTTIEAIAVASGYTESSVVTGRYTLSPPGNGPAVSVVVTTDNQAMLLATQASVAFSTATGGSNVIYVDETQPYQSIEGFGAATTDSAMYLLNEIAKPNQPGQFDQTMNDLFTRQGNGIGLSFLRNPMGASDIARSEYTFDDLPSGQTDPSLASFSILHDQADIIPLILQAEQLNPQLEIVATPWSPPAWMKTSASLNGGSLLSTMYAPFANYFVKYLQAYSQAHVTINYITLQNEPLYDTSTNPSPYPGMLMDPATQTTVLRDYVLPALSANNLSTKVLVYDHNWDQPSYPETVLSDSTLLASAQVAGTAWHGYAGTPGAMLTLENMFPTKGAYETEHSGGTWVADQVKADFEEITQNMRNGAKAYVKWSLALDENRGPHTGGCGTCNPLVTVNSTSGAITYDVEFYTLGHFSKYVLSGAKRIYSSNAAGLVTAAFINPDNSKALVAYNDSNAVQTFFVQWGTQSFTYTLPALAGATFTWTGTQSAGSPAYTLPAKSQPQASSFNSTSGNNVPGNYLTWGLETELTSDTNGGYDVGYSADGDYAVYKSVDFGTGVANVSARVACLQNNGQGNGGGNCGGTLEFHLDSPTGGLIASVTIPSTGGWQTWQTTQSSAAVGATGVHDLYVVFKAPAGGTTSLGNLNWFEFK